MSRAIHIEGVLFLSASEAGRRFGFTNDYISRLAREEKITGKRIGNQWFINPDSLRRFKYRGDEEKIVRKQELRALRKQERAMAKLKTAAVVAEASAATTAAAVGGYLNDRSSRITALLRAGAVVGAGTVLGAWVFLATHGVPLNVATPISFDAMKRIAYGVYHFDTIFTGKSVATVFSGTERMTAESVFPTNAKRGVVVFEDDGTETDESIKQYFSDEVRVATDADGQSGVIEPIFKSDVEERYRFLLVPIRGP